MSVADQITRINTAKADIKTAIEAKGVTVPSSAKIDTYDDYIAAIPTQSDLTFNKCQYLFYKGRLLNNADQIILSPNKSGSSPSEKIMDYTGLFEGNGRVTTPSGYTQAGLGLKGWNKVTNAKIILDRCFKDVVFEGIETEAEGILALPKYDSLDQITSCDDLLNGSRCKNGSVSGRITLGPDSNSRFNLANCTSYKRAFKNTEGLVLNPVYVYDEFDHYVFYVPQNNINLSECFYGTIFKDLNSENILNIQSATENTKKIITVDDNCEGMIRNADIDTLHFYDINFADKYDKPLSYYYFGGGSDDNHYNNNTSKLYFDRCKFGNALNTPVYGFFANMRSLSYIYFPSSNSFGAFNMNYMFYKCESLEYFDMSKLTDYQMAPSGLHADIEEYYNTFTGCTSMTSIDGLNVSYIGGRGTNYEHMIQMFGDGSDSSNELPNLREIYFSGSWKSQVPPGDYNENKYADVYIDLRPLSNLKVTKRFAGSCPDNISNVNTSRPEGQQGYIHFILNDNVSPSSSTVQDSLLAKGIKLEYVI